MLLLRLQPAAVNQDGGIELESAAENLSSFCTSLIPNAAMVAVVAAAAFDGDPPLDANWPGI